MKFLKGFCKYILNSLFFSAVLSFSFQVFADELSEVNSKALEKTMELLQNKSQRDQFIEENPQAGRADNNSKQLFGDGAQLEQAYKLASEIFRKLATENNGDVTKMLEQITNGKQNPEQFYKSLDASQKKLILDLSKGVEERNKKAHP